jgi:hypothetical protein
MSVLCTTSIAVLRLEIGALLGGFMKYQVLIVGNFGVNDYGNYCIVGLYLASKPLGLIQIAQHFTLEPGTNGFKSNRGSIQ